MFSTAALFILSKECDAHSSPTYITHTHTQGGARQYACALLDAPSIHMVPVCFAIAADARSQSMSLFPAPRCLHPKPATPFADYYLDAQEPGMEQLSVHCLYRPSQSFPSW